MRLIHTLTPILLVVSATAWAADKPGYPERRLSWDDSSVVGSPDPLLPYKTVQAFPNLKVKLPATLAPEPGTDRLFLIEHLAFWSGPGRLSAIRDDQGATEVQPLVDLDGLAVCLAFHPDYVHNGYVYIGMNGPVHGRPKTSQVVRFTVAPRSEGRIDPASKKVMIEWPSNGHDGCGVAFGKDGYLYATAGDGTSDSDGNLTGQDLKDLPGSAIRIDVDHPDAGRNYSIPKDNPFLGRPGARPELWCYGLRNPWKMSCDKVSGQIWVGNNGQDLWEQAYLIKKGANYGWSVTEGGHPFRAQRQAGPDPISPPTAEHPHSDARSLTGGQVYRGKRLPELVGAYIYGDWSTGKVWGIKVEGDKVLWHRLLVDTPFSITGFGADHDGEFYVIDQLTGFHRLEPTTEADKPAKPFPTRLSQTGVFASVAPLELNPAAIPYQVVAPQWADGAKIDRALAVPGMQLIEQKPQRNAGGDWTFPNGSVLVQTLTVDLLDTAGKSAPKKVETRLLTRQQDEWVGYSYRWNADQTDAELVGDSGDSAEFEVADPAAAGGRREKVWKFPSRAECMSCHSRAMGFVLGFNKTQLEREVAHGGKPTDQIQSLEKVGLFKDALPSKDDDRHRLVDPYDPKAPTEARVRSYLSVNCSTCHIPEGGGNSRIVLTLSPSLGEMNMVDQPQVHSNLGIADAKVIAAGSPERSILFQRMSRRGGDQMPPLVSTEADKQALELLDRWIRGLKPASK